MGDAAHDSESGQGLVEYALILAVIAVVAAAAVIYFSGAVIGLFGSTSNFPGGGNAPSEPVTPPVQWPSSVQQCVDGGWRQFPQFTDEASCVRFVTGGG
jgi:Flp pilus assembly pilin Flp